MVQNMMEILAPAGDWDMLRAAVFSGADCVYIGVAGFNARRSAANFEGEDLQKAVSFCHARGCKVYAAMNTLVLPGQQQQAFATLQQLATAGCDAVIVQDLGVAQMAKAFPGLVLHASTQMSVHSLAGVRQLAEMGFSRAILARELEQAEIEEIARHSPIELEVFVHGALCVSVSGQCSMSAFLGGRSANRGACAGTCRLPFYAKMEQNHWEEASATHSPAQDGSHHLSLKDMSVLEALPALAQMGIASAKIEGRLRGPEYTAVVVDAAHKILQGQPYDQELLRNVFSRSGFTNGWFAGRPEKEMFGFRTPQDTAAGKAAQPKARELYRREMPRVAVSFLLVLSQQGAELTVEDGRNTVTQKLEQPLSPAQKQPEPALLTALQKTGGTPFYTVEENCEIQANGLFLPGPSLGDLRRKALDELLLLREAPPAQNNQVLGFATGLATVASDENAQHAKNIKQQRKEKGRPLLRGWFETLEQVPPLAWEVCQEVVLPLTQWEKVPQPWRSKTRLWLPRTLFGQEEPEMQTRVTQAKGQGFAGFEAQNLAHWWLCKGEGIASAAGLNIANEQAVRQAMLYSPHGVTLSPELTLRQIQHIASQKDIQQNAILDVLCYGHLPVMLTRACPLKNVTNCARCAKQGKLVDRKGKTFPVFCHGQVRSIHNGVPLWMGDRLPEMAVDTATMVFTMETKEQATQIITAFCGGQPAPGEFTRGLYDRGLAE